MSERDQKEKSENITMAGELKKNRKKDEKVERKQKGKVRFYAKQSDVRVAYYAKQPCFVLVYKEACLNTNDLNPSLPSVVDSLL